MSAIVVQKFNHNGQLITKYDGAVLDSGPHWVCLRAIFQRADVNLGFVTFRQGDVFIEWFYDDRWYNIFAIHDRDTGELKGWYCNISLPAEFQPDSISYVDLALDLLVYPDGRMIVLDEDEFAALDINETRRETARRALNELKGWFDQPVSLRLEALNLNPTVLFIPPHQPQNNQEKSQ